jgi:hypothetical protein
MNKFSPKKYLKEKGRKLPIEECLISDNYENRGLTMCLLVRKQPGGKFSIASILIDRLCLGVKNSIGNCNMTDMELNDMIDNMRSNAPVEKVSPAYFHNVVYGAIDYASELGFGLPKDFYLAEYLLDEDFIDDGIDDIEMGWEGKPMYVQGPYDNSQKILSTLSKSVGEDGYECIISEF